MRELVENMIDSFLPSSSVNEIKIFNSPTPDKRATYADF